MSLRRQFIIATRHLGKLPNSPIDRVSWPSAGWSVSQGVGWGTRFFIFPLPWVGAPSPHLYWPETCVLSTGGRRSLRSSALHCARIYYLEIIARRPPLSQSTPPVATDPQQHEKVLLLSVSLSLDPSSDSHSSARPVL